MTTDKNKIAHWKEIRNRKIALLASLLPEERHRFCQEFSISSLDEALGWSLAEIQWAIDALTDDEQLRLLRRARSARATLNPYYADAGGVQ